MTLEALWPLLLLPLLGVVVLVALRSDLRWPKLRLRASLVLRLLAAAFLLLALCRPVVRAGSREVAVAFVVDVSRSVASGSMQDAVAWAREASRALGVDDAHFVAFADRAVSVPDADALLEVQVFDSGAAAGLPPPDALDQGRTNIEAALRHAAARLPPDRLKRVVLFSDGRETEGDTAAALAFLKEAGVRVFPAPSGVRSDGGGFVNAIRLPPVVRAGEMTGVEAEVFSATGGAAEIRVLADGEVLAAIEVELPPGASTVPVPVRVEEPGMTVLEAEILVAGDRLPVNDRRAVEVPVQDEASVLYVEGQPASARYLRSALESEGVTVNTAPASALPRLDLNTWDAVVLSDVAPDRLPEALVNLAGVGIGQVIAALPPHHRPRIPVLDSTPAALLPKVIEPPGRVREPDEITPRDDVLPRPAHSILMLVTRPESVKAAPSGSLLEMMSKCSQSIDSPAFKLRRRVLPKRLAKACDQLLQIQRLH